MEKTTVTAEKYTEKQKLAISAGEPNVLVSAAAGSGKTHVLSKRVELLVRGADLAKFREDGTEETRPGLEQDIRRMLVVTFTRAAASEMRERIVDRLTRAAQAADAGESLRLHEQAEAAAGADITTFHGFCRKVIAERYEDAGVASGFTILNDAQASALRSACVREVFDEFYEKEDAGVARLLERFGKNGDDADLMGIVTGIYDKMMGRPDWEEWLRRSLKDPAEYVEELRQILDKVVAESVAGAARRQAAVVRQNAESAVDGKKTRQNDEEYLRSLRALEAACETLGATQTLMVNEKPKCKNKPRGEDLFEEGRALRDEAKSLINDAYGQLSLLEGDGDGEEGAIADLRYTQADVSVLVELVEAFEKKYTSRKLASNRIDFSDLEHRALKVLDERGGEYAEKYQHIFVDEYQDTSPVQEAILERIHPRRGNGWVNSLFLVGDMKQSIYGFRFADPTIFRRKSLDYADASDEQTRVIDMNNNFRSSPAVIDAVNALMEEIMNENLGGLPYTEREKLVYRDGAPEPETRGNARILVAEIGDEDMEKAQREAELIADRIASVAGPGRRDYGDVAVMYRSRGPQSIAIAKALEERGIPYVAEKGYGTVYAEIDVFLNLLSLVLNDRQDVPLLSVMRSFMFDFDEEEIMRVVDWSKERGGADGRPFFRRLRHFHRDKSAREDEPELYEKVDRFFESLEKLRRVGTDMSVSRFAEEAADRFGFVPFLLTRPNGEARRRKFEVLLESLAGLQEIYGNSLRRVLDMALALKKRNELFREESGVASVPGAVRLLTVHGSKGLEFPVVFLAGCEKKFNDNSWKGSILTSDRFGVTVQYVNPERILRRDTLETTLAKRHLRAAAMDEELRILYVALTRAREELYICGAVKDMDASMREWEAAAGNYGQAKNILEWVMGAWFALKEKGNPVADSLFAADEETGSGGKSERQPFDWNAFLEEAERLRPQAQTLAGLSERIRVPSVQHVSKVAEEEFGEHMWKARAPLFLKPSAETDDEITGSQKGTLTHRFLQYAVARRLNAKDALESMIESRLLTEAEQRQLEKDIPKLNRFFESDLYARLRKADRVLVEQKFMLPVPPEDIGMQATKGEQGMIRLKGMIDLAFREGNEWILVDYKSDKPQPDENLIERYGRQVRLYERALAELTGQRVAERFLFLTETGKALEIPG